MKNIIYTHQIKTLTMKTLFTIKQFRIILSFLAIFISGTTYSQLTTECLDFTPLENNVAIHDDLINPAGSVLISTNGLELIKTGLTTTGNFQVYAVTPSKDGMDYGGWVTVNTSKISCTKNLYFTYNAPFVVVDGDTITSFPFTGSTYSVSTASINASEVMIQGSFNQVQIGGGTSTIANVCVVYDSKCTITSSNELKVSTLVNDIYPNPSAGQLFLDVSAPNTVIQVHNLLGELIFSKTTGQTTGLQEIQLNSAGLFIVTASDGNTTEQYKVLNQ
jgi:hypothetical protein